LLARAKHALVVADADTSPGEPVTLDTVGDERYDLVCLRVFSKAQTDDAVTAP
jgi:hypothetical protein